MRRQRNLTYAPVANVHEARGLEVWDIPADKIICTACSEFYAKTIAVYLNLVHHQLKYGS